MTKRQPLLFSPDEICLAKAGQTIKLWVNGKQYKKFKELMVHSISGTRHRRAHARAVIFDLDLVKIHRETLDGCVHLVRK